MASEKIKLGINLRKNTNSKSLAFGKYYPEVDQQKTLSLRGFAQHMVDHGSIYGRDIVEGVLIKITECLPELVAQGVPVQLGSLGIFYPTAEVSNPVVNIAAMEGSRPTRLREGYPHPLPARHHEAGQHRRTGIQECLCSGAAQHRGERHPDRGRQGEALPEADAHRDGHRREQAGALKTRTLTIT